jgi:hypothetical protein
MKLIYGIMISQVVCFAQVVDATPMSVLQSFLVKELNGDCVARRGMVQSSKWRSKKEEKRDPLLKGYVNDWTSDPFIVVTDFKIVKTSELGGRHTFSVEFTDVAKVIDRGDMTDKPRVLVDFNNKDSVDYIVTRVNGRYMISDPPTPRVFLDALIKYYDNFPEIKQDASRYEQPSQRNYHDRLVQELKYLESMQVKLSQGVK